MNIATLSDVIEADKEIRSALTLCDGENIANAMGKLYDLGEAGRYGSTEVQASAIARVTKLLRGLSKLSHAARRIAATEIATIET